MSNIVIYILSFFDKLYQKKIINKLKQIFNNNLDVVFDVGAHKGEFVKLITKNFITNKIYSFEPSEKSFTILKNNISDKKINSNQIFLNNFGLGMINEKKKFKQMKESSSSTLSEINTDTKYFRRKNFFLNFGSKSKIFEETIVNIENGFSFIEKKKIEKIDLLKIDTEGHEYFVIKGFGENLKKIKVIFFEHHYDNMIIKNYTFSEIHNYLIEKNFKAHSKFKMPFRKSFEYIYLNKKN